MATILFSAVGSALGASIGGGVLGISSVVLGRAAGAMLGRALDQRLLGGGAEAVETGRMERFRLTGAGEGASIPRLYGRMRLAGHVIWSSAFLERRRTTGGGGKGGAPRPAVTEFSYTVSLALALCEGPVSGIGRIWADGQEIDLNSLTYRLHRGDEDQVADGLIEAIEGAGQVPAWRGTAYVVIEDLVLGPYGNRVPQLSFEVFRPQMAALPGVTDDPALAIRGVALMPGTGEYALASSDVRFDLGAGETRLANVSGANGQSDLLASLNGLQAELPQVSSALLVVSWFGDDLRAGECRVMPRVEQKLQDGAMPWRVAGWTRASAKEVPKEGANPVYGGTPTDQSVIEAIRALKERGIAPVFYPFLLMCQQNGNDLPDPYSGAEGQPVLPWRGRITASIAPGREASPDGTEAAEDEVAAFFGQAEVADFSLSGTEVVYSGPDEMSYRRFILHYAHLCAAAGGVFAFCIGSELRGLTWLRGAGGSYPAVEELCRLAADCRAVLGPEVKIGYAADWSEYFGHHPGGGEVIFHLDPLWSDENIDFIGIDNYMPLSDWREGETHADAAWRSVYDLDYLRSNVAGGEGFDWYYGSSEGRAAQMRLPIKDGAYGEDWVWRYKDLVRWWSMPHHNRPGGVRDEEDTGWQPGMKPIWFTEIGCPAVDKGSNQPNVFWDPKSSESFLPYSSKGRRDDLMQMQYLRALLSYWAEPANNPVSPIYGGPMVDLGRAHVWCWDARPFPEFPSRSDLWADAGNYALGHWLNGRGGARSLASVVAEICRGCGIEDYDVSRLYGLLRGYAPDSTETGRSVLQTLSLAYGFDVVERDGVMQFRSRGGAADGEVDRGEVVAGREADIELVRAPEAEVSGRVQLSYIEGSGSYEHRAAEAIFPDEAARRADRRELPLALEPSEARALAERWLAEARIARESLRLVLPPSRLALGADDVITLEGADYRIDRVEISGQQTIEATRVERAVYQPSDSVEEPSVPRPFEAVGPVLPLFLDLPLIKGDELPHAPHLAVTARPWTGAAAVWSSDRDDGYELDLTVPGPATAGVLLAPLARGPVGRFDRFGKVNLRLTQGELGSVDDLAVLNGANLAAIGDGTSGRWEVLQFSSAELIAPRVWELTGLLRGQFGSDAVMSEVWPEGSYFVLLDRALRQLPLAAHLRGLPRHYRIGPAARGYQDALYQHRIEAFAGIGLRPLSPVHLRETHSSEGRSYCWIRQSRIEADSWEGLEIPLGEEVEAYRVQVWQGDVLRREAEVTEPRWTYSEAEILADGLTGPATVTVAQLSPRFGAGLAARLGTEF